MQNLRHLQELGLVEEMGCLSPRGGRKARVLSCVLDAKVAIGLDITKNHAGIVGGGFGQQRHPEHSGAGALCGR